MKILKKIRPFILLIIFVIIWEKLAIQLDNNAILPRVGKVWFNFTHAFEDFIGIGNIPANLFYSLVRVFVGYILAVILAIPLGLFMGVSERFRAYTETFVNVFKPVPSISWQPLVLAWFGILSLGRVFDLDYGKAFVVLDNFKLSMISIITIGAFFPIWTSTLDGVSNVRNVLIESALTLGASKKDIFFDVVLPASAPAIVNGLRGGLTSAWAALVASEMLPGSMKGIGYMISHARELTRMDIVVTGIIIIGAIGALFDYIFKKIAEKNFAWRKFIR